MVSHTLRLKLGVEEVIGLSSYELITTASKASHHGVEDQSLGTRHGKPASVQL
jgi:hypothetical protein